MCWIKLHKGVTEWEWHDNPCMISLWVHLLCKATHKEIRWHGRVIQRGQIVTTVAKLSEMVGASVQSIRTCLQHLKETGEVTSESTNKYTIITICNYDRYQLQEDATQQTSNNEITNNQQTINKPIISRRKEEKEKDTLKGIKKEKAQTIVPFRSEEFWKSWDDLMTMPKWRNKSTRALETALKKLGEYDEGTAMAAIATTIAGDYQGIFPEKERGRGAAAASRGTVIDAAIQAQKAREMIYSKRTSYDRGLDVDEQ